MKQTVFSLLVICAIVHQASAQWIQQTSNVRNNLRDVAFYNSAIGYAVGEGGIVLKTINGGNRWVAVTSPDKSDIVSVTVPDSNAVMVTTASINNNTAVYESVNGGASWRKVLTDMSSFYATATPDKSLYSVSSQVYNSNDFGRNWQAQQKLNPTSAYSQITFSNNKTGMIAGNISGAVTYSADFLRTTDGHNWYRGYNFSFPNANGFSCFSPVGADSVLMFTNYYNRYLPGDSSQLILMNHFTLQNSFGTYFWFFDNRILVNSFPDKIDDCQFYSGGNGYAVSEKGIIYKIMNLGKSISKEFSSKTPLHAICMIDKNYGFAVGDNGLIVKRKMPGINGFVATTIPVNVYPNPAAEQLQVSFNLTEATALQLQITNENGNLVLVQPAKQFEKGRVTIPVCVGNLPRGNYHISLLNHRTEMIGSAQLMIVH